MLYIGILELLVAMTKQNKELSVILSTSEFNYTFALGKSLGQNNDLL